MTTFSRPALLALVTLVAACRERPAASDAGAQVVAVDAGVRRGGPGASGPAGARQPGVVRRLAPITVDEVQALLPAPPGARVIKPVGKAKVGERVEGAWCFDAGELAALGPAVQQQLGAAGWQDVALKPNPNLPDRVTIVGGKAPYALFGSLQRGKWAECDAGQGQTYLSLGVHHVEAVGPGGTVGARGTGDLQLR